jgi:hypothetical protein
VSQSNGKWAFSDSLNYILKPMINQVTIQTGVHHPPPSMSYSPLINEGCCSYELQQFRAAVEIFPLKKSGLFSM